MTVQEFRRACREGWRPQLVDVRSATEFAAGHIPGAANIPLTQLDARCRDLNQGIPLVLVSQNGARAELAHKMLGGCHGNIALIAGGTTAWEKAGLPIVTCQNSRWSLERQARLSVGMLLLVAVALAIFVHPSFVYVAGLVGCGLLMAGLTDVCLMGTLMGRMPWNGSPCPPPSDDLNREQTEAPQA